MIDKIETYCQVEFLDHFFKEIENLDTTSLVFKNLGEDFKSIDTMINLIFFNSNLLVDNYDHIAKKALDGNVFYDRLIKSYTQGGSKIIPFENDFQFVLEESDYRQSLNPSSIQILNKNADHWDDGLLSVSPDNWKLMANKLGMTKSIKVYSEKSLNEFDGWALLNQLGIPINSALIADNYIHKSLETNLFQIIENLIPEAPLSIDFHLGLITCRDDFTDKDVKNVTSFVNSLQRPYHIDFSVYRPFSKIHDRNILTNYYRINSGHSLDYYDQNQKIKGNKSTTLEIFGIASRSQNVHFKLLKEMKTLIKNCKDDDINGSSKNRLLDVV